MLGGCVGDEDGGFAELPCDTLDADCQRAVYRATAEVAQMPAADRPPVREISVAQLADELREHAEPEDPDAERGWSRALALLGLLPEEQSLRDAALEHEVGNVAAYYDAERKMVSLVDRGSRGPEQDLIVLAHELTHALRDAESDLIAFRERFATSTDSYAATAALTEGEAMVVAAAVVARTEQGASYSVNWDRLGAELDEAVFDTIDAAPAPLIAAVEQLPYAFGTRLLGEPWDTEGRAVVDALYDAPKLALLHWSGGLSGLVAPDPLTCLPTAPPPGYAGEDSDSLGIAGLLALQVALGTNGARAAMSASQSWRDDRMVIFRPDADSASAERAVMWRIRFASPATARGFAQRVGCCLPDGVRLSEHDDELLLLAASAPGVLESWTEAASCGRSEDLPVTD